MFVKICGLTNEDDALLAVALGADALGFVLVSGSPRQIAPADLRSILRRLPPGTITVGVFRDERPERVVETVNELGLTGAQLHGREPISEVRAVRRQVPFVVQAFRAGDLALGAAANGPADVVLVDSATPGSGRVFDWALAEGVPGGVRLLLAGGLTADNVGEAIQRVRPWGVDVATGVETRPGSGRKDALKLRRFVERARAAGDAIAGAAVSGLGGDADAPLDDRPAPYDWQADERP